MRVATTRFGDVIGEITSPNKNTCSENRIHADYPCPERLQNKIRCDFTEGAAVNANLIPFFTCAAKELSVEFDLQDTAARYCKVLKCTVPNL